MTPKTRNVISFIFRVANSKNSFFFWLFIRFISSILPLVTIYQFSLVVKFLEDKKDLHSVVLLIFALFVVRILDNFLRLKSITKLEFIIGMITFDIHNFFLSDLKSETKEGRHAAVQAIRNFADASSVTLNLIKQPGIDSLVSFIFIPTILFFLDFQVFVITMAYIVIYYFIDRYTTQRYIHLKDILNTKTESYYARLQLGSDYDLEQISFDRHFLRLTRWGFSEWFVLQNTAVIFYSLSLLYLVYAVVDGSKQLSDLILLAGYLTQVQVFLNAFSTIQDSLSDMFVGLNHLAKSDSVSAIDLEDLI